MSAEYNQYLANHRDGVKQAFLWMADHMPGIMDDMQDFYYLDILKHDESKYEDDEYEAYDQYFYGNNRTPEVVDAFDKAWLHHIHHNPHHWQHWVIPSDDPEKPDTVIEMPKRYVIEMVCDWFSFSFVRNNPSELFEWWSQHKDYCKLHPNTKSLVEEIIGSIRLAVSRGTVL